MFTIEEKRYMKYLRVDNRKGQFLKDGNWVDITSLGKDDLMRMVRAALEDGQFKLMSLTRTLYQILLIKSSINMCISSRLIYMLVGMSIRKQREIFLKKLMSNTVWIFKVAWLVQIIDLSIRSPKNSRYNIDMPVSAEYPYASMGKT